MSVERQALAVTLRAIAMTPQDPSLFGIPVDFVLFGLTLLGVAIFHRHTMYVALTGLVVITTYKIVLLASKPALE